MRAFVYPSFYEILTSLSEEFTCDWAKLVFETPSERILLVVHRTNMRDGTEREEESGEVGN